jgi:hypothetical protein
MPRGSDWLIDDHPPRLSKGLAPEGGVHVQATADEAAVRGWYFRQSSHGQLEPDTRRCRFCGEIMYAPLALTQAERDTRHGLSTNVLLGEPTVP